MSEDRTLDWSLPQTTFFLVWFVFFSLVTLFTGIWYHLRRTLQPIKARLPILNSIANVYNLFITAMLCFNRILASTFPCELDQYLGYIYLFLATFYLIRCWVLYFRFMWTQEVASCQDLMKMGSTLTRIGLHNRSSTRNLGATGASSTLLTPAPSATKGLWYSRHMYLISPWFLSVFYICCVIILLIPPSVAIATGNVVDNGGNEVTRCAGISRGWETLIYIAYVCGYLYLAFRLATTFDYFHIKDELKTLGLFVVPMFILWIVSSNVFTTYRFPISTLVSLCIVAFAQAMSTIYPLYLSFYQVPKLDLTSADVTSFDGLLRTENGFASFKTFLEGEFAIENLLFFQTAEDYKDVAILTVNYHHKDDPDWRRPRDENILKEGYLSKAGGPMSSMRRRYLVLKHGTLFVYANKQDPEEERLDLSGGIKMCDLSTSKPGVRSFGFYIQLPGEIKKHVFGPHDAKQRDSWKQGFKAASKWVSESVDKKENTVDDIQEYWALKRGEGGPRPLTGAHWRSELVAYALEIFFIYIEEDGFAPVQLQNGKVLEKITSILRQTGEEKSRVVSPTKASVGAGVADALGVDQDPEELEAMETGRSPSGLHNPDTHQNFDLQSVVGKLAAKIEKDIDIDLLPNLFNEAQEEIFNMMQSDSFRRYVRSHLYTDFMEKEKEEQRKRKLALLTFSA